MYRINILFVVFVMLLMPLFLFGQTTDEQQQNAAGNQETIEEGEVTELGEQVIKVTIEKPQVKLFTDRIKPEFDDVHLDKSFMREIVGKGERLVIEEKTNNEKTPQIKVEKLIKRLR